MKKGGVVKPSVNTDLDSKQDSDLNMKDDDQDAADQSFHKIL